jgi:hypothetical protein
MVYKVGLNEAVHRFSPTYLLWILCNSIFIYFYVRNSLIAWHVEFTAIAASIVYLLVKALFFETDIDGRIVVAGVFLYGGVLTYGHL